MKNAAFVKSAIEKSFLALLLSVFAIVSAHCADSVRVAVVRNSLNGIADEAQLICDCFERFIKRKRISDSAEMSYFSFRDRVSEARKARKGLKNAAASEDDAAYEGFLETLARLDRTDGVQSSQDAKEEAQDLILPVQATAVTFDKFDLRALHQKSRILADYIADDNDSDYIVIPASVPLDNSLIRSRMILYSCIDKSWTVIYDEIVRQSEFSEHVRENFVGIFPFFLPEGMGVLNFTEKEFGYEVFYDGEKVEDDSVFERGPKVFTVTSPGYEDAQVEIDIREDAVNDLDFTLFEKVNSRVIFDGDGRFYRGFSSEKGLFDVPDIMFDYKTPQSISFSYPGFATKYISLVGDADRVDVLLKPNYLLDEGRNNAVTRRFYTTVLVSIFIFAADVASRSFLEAYPDSNFWQISQKALSYMGYFSISLLVINLFDYFFSNMYAFE